MPAFSLPGFALSVALTRDMGDRDRAMQLAFVGGMIGGTSPAGVLLVSALARADDTDTLPGRPPGTTAPQLPDVTRVQVPDLPRDPDEATELLTRRGLKGAIVRVESDD